MSDGRAEIGAAASRRRVLTGAGAAGAAAVLAACGTDPDPDSGVPEAPASTDPSAGPDTSATPDSGDGSGDDGAAAEPLAPADEIEVGGGLILEEEDLVITQPSDGEWRGFSATCTHQGCTVSDIDNGTIFCACHQSRYSLEDGSVLEGPAPQPLPAKEIAVQDGNIVWA